MKTRTAIRLLVLSLLPVLLSAQPCGNVGGNCPPPPCGQGGGTNLFNPFSGNVWREITDLELPAALGQRPLEFRRLSTSRYHGGLVMPMGPSGNWRHNYLWAIHYRGLNGEGHEMIEIHYPDGHNWTFAHATEDALYMTANSRTEDRVEKVADTSPQRYRLWQADGNRLEFVKYTDASGETAYKPLGEYDKHNLFHAYTLDDRNRVVRVTDPAGHYLQLNYGPVGNFTTAFVVFSHQAPDAQSVSVAGDFNGWSTTAHPMVRDEDGRWTITVPLQAGSSASAVTHQYKFVVDGGTWLPDPANPDTFPEGGPDSGNNSVLSIGYDDDQIDFAADVPVRFEIHAPDATSVSIAGSFNAWSADTHPMTREGDTWTLQTELGQGAHLYKFVIDGSTWQADPVNPFTAPDGYGSHNSRLVVGPLREALTDVQTSDGRAVFYDYAVFRGTATLYAALTAVNYSDGHNAAYTYGVTRASGERPRLASADDPRYESPDGARIAYEYRSGGVAGFITKEKNLVTGETIVELLAENETERRLVSGDRIEILTFAGPNMVSRSHGSQPAPVRQFFDDGYGMLRSETDVLGHTTRYQRTWEFGAVTTITLPDGATRTTAYTDATKPFHPATETDELGRVTTYTRDADGRPVRVDHPDGSHETWTYNAFGQPLVHRLRNGGTESFTYDDAGHKTTYTNALGQSTTYTYHSDGRLASETDPLGRVTAHAYNARGQEILRTHPDGSTTAWSYDAYGNTLSESDENGAVTAHSYDEHGRRILTLNPLGHATRFAYDGGVSGCGSCGYKDQPDQIISPLGIVTEFTYDPAGRVLTETVGLGLPEAATTTYAYDAAGRLLSRTGPLGHAWSYAYDSRGRRTAETDPLGHATTFTYDAVGNRLSRTLPGGAATTWTHDAMNRLLTETDPLSQATSYAYDAGGRLASTTDPLGRVTAYTHDLLDRQTRATHPDSSTTSRAYDAAGQLLSTTDELDRITTYAYDKRGRLVVVSNPLEEPVDYAYDAAGRRTAEMLPGGLTRHSEYDAAGRITSVTTADGTEAETTVTYTYDADGRLLTETGPLGQATTHTYDAHGRRTATTTPLGLVTRFTHDLAGNSTATTRPDGSRSTRTHDALGRVLSETDPAGDTIAYAYTPAGQLASITDARSAVTRFTHDAAGRRTAKTYADGSVERSAYDAAGQLTRFTNARGITRDYAYDTRGRLTAIDYSDATPDVHYTYNAAGQRTTAGNAHAAINYAYDGAGRSSGETHALTGHPLGNRAYTLRHNVDARLTRITYPGSSAPAVDYSYDRRGNLAGVSGSGFRIDYSRRLDDRIHRITFSNGVVNNRSYDADNRLVDTAYRRGSAAPFSRAAYTLDSLGRRTALERANGSGDAYTYDAKDQVIAARYEVPDPAASAAVSGSSPRHRATFTYDAMGNRTRADNGFGSAVTYTANKLNQYTAVSTYSAAPVYDSDGNLVSSDGLDLAWDAENRLIQIAPAFPLEGDRRIRYAYDPLGRRVRKTVAKHDGHNWSEESDTHYTYWDWNVIEEHRSPAGSPSETRRLVWGEDLGGRFQTAGGVGGLLLQQIEGGIHDGAQWHYHYDGNGNVTELTNASGATVATYRYTAFGDIWSATGTAAQANHYRFSTKPIDGEMIRSSSSAFNSGLYYYGYRFYDPGLGRWFNRDPIGEQGGINLYAMVGNDPVNWADMLGLKISFPRIHPDIGRFVDNHCPNSLAETCISNGFWSETVIWTNNTLSTNGPGRKCDKSNAPWDKTVEEIVSTRRGTPFGAGILAGGSQKVYVYAKTKKTIYRCRLDCRKDGTYKASLTSVPSSGGQGDVHYKTIRLDWTRFNGTGGTT